MSLITRLGVAALIGLSGSLVLAETAAATTPAAPAAPEAAKPAAKKVSQSRKELDSKAKGLALATATVEQINDNQLAIASRVLTGKADCEFSQNVTVEPVVEHPGHFRVNYKKAKYVMVPEETSTGAVRLVDKKAGIVWLQIPVKSMMMNTKLGQRMVDGCTHAEQRAAIDAVKAAGSTR